MRRGSWTALICALAAVGCGDGATGSVNNPEGPPTGGDPGGSSGGSIATAPPTPGPGGTPPSSSSGSSGAVGSGSGSGAGSASAPDAGAEAGSAVLDERVVDYGEALRTASLKLVGDLPTLAQIHAIENAGSAAQQATVYAADIDAMLADPRFATQMIEYWRDIFKTGDQPLPAGTKPVKGAPDLDTAATFAAQVVVAGRPFTDILTATTGTCPTFASGAFTAANCNNNAPTAGVLTDPGIQSQYFAHMAFRRTRFVQEIFVCSPFPAEYSTTPTQMGQSLYTSPWPFTSIAGGASAPINFQDTSAVICANCHTTLNHIAPLFSYFDANGNYVAGQVQVQTPVVPPVTSQLSDWLPAGQQTFAWRDGTAVTDIPSLALAIAADPDVPMCAVNRVWDWAFNRGDIVNDLATIPTTVTQTFVQDFTKNGMNLQKIIREIFTSDDFVRF
jgi:hypothetical protein